VVEVAVARHELALVVPLRDRNLEQLVLGDAVQLRRERRENGLLGRLRGQIANRAISFLLVASLRVVAVPELVELLLKRV